MALCTEGIYDIYFASTGTFFVLHEWQSNRTPISPEVFLPQASQPLYTHTSLSCRFAKQASTQKNSSCQIVLAYSSKRSGTQYINEFRFFVLEISYECIICKSGRSNYSNRLGATQGQRCCMFVLHSSQHSYIYIYIFVKGLA